ncbi:MAG: M48 family metallopeptidase [Methanobrevibacter sp.]|nr:M48 family metallopeptidase [Methanobrevibacter sp.]
MVIKETLEIEGISINLERKRIKNIYLRVLPDATVRLSVPERISEDYIREYVKSNLDWIKKTQKRMLENPPKPKVMYKNGETHHIWGEEYKIQLISNEKIKRAFYDANESIIYLPVKKRSTVKEREKVLFELYREEMNRNIGCFLDKCIPIVGERPIEIKFRNMKNWGNCRKDKRITLNIKLAKKPPICTEYVLIHELCHLIEFNHSPRFKSLMDNFCPNWREIKKLLNEAD